VRMRQEDIRDPHTQALWFGHDRCSRLKRRIDHVGRAGAG
jgi:hypothetical protein